MALTSLLPDHTANSRPRLTGAEQGGLRSVILLYNPASGRHRERRMADISAVLSELRLAGVPASAVATRGPGTAGEQAREAVEAGADAVFACGGDGTVHEVLQGMVGTGAAMGVIPLGTANALAVDLGIPRNPVLAARALLAAERRRIAVGRMEYSLCANPPHPVSPEAGETRVGHPVPEGPKYVPCGAPRLAPGNRGREPGAPTRVVSSSIASRYFTVTAGIGADAHLFYSMNYASKRRFGNPYYYSEAVRVWATHPYPLFEVQYANASGEPQRAEVSQVLAVRIARFGGLLRHLAPGASLRNDFMRLVLFKTRSRARYLQYMAAIVCGRKPHVPGIEFADATSVQCRLLNGGDCRIYAEADGELLGALPVNISIVPDAVTLLTP